MLKILNEKCRASAITENNELMKTREEHNHDITAGKSRAQNVIKISKNLSEKYTPIVAAVSASLQFALPIKDKLIRTAAHPHCLKLRNSWDFWKLSLVWQRIKRSRANKFVRWPQKSERSGKSFFCLAVGTVKIAPKTFYQLYYIHVSVSGIAPACMYAFRPKKKTEKTTIAFCKRFIWFSTQLPAWTSFVRFWASCSSVIPTKNSRTHLSGCFFHLSQNYLTKNKEMNQIFAMASNMMIFLAFQKKGWRFLWHDRSGNQSICHRNCSEPKKFEKIGELCLYIGSAYIKSMVPNREVLFPLSLCNQRDAAESGIAKTTIAVEGRPVSADPTQICGKL